MSPTNNASTVSVVQLNANKLKQKNFQPPELYIPNCLLSLFSELSMATDSIPMASFCRASTLRGIPSARMY